MSQTPTTEQLAIENALLAQVHNVTQIFMSEDCEAELRQAFRRAIALWCRSPLNDRWAITFQDQGAHVLVQVRCGVPGSRALLGSLVMTPEEAEHFKRALGFSSGPG